VSRGYVHDPELNILRAVLIRGSFEGSLFRGLHAAYFRDADYANAWEYLREHYTAYGKVPARETFLKDHPGLKDFVLGSEPPEPAEFYADQILESYARHGLAEALVSEIPKLEDDVGDGIRGLKDVLSQFELARNNVDVLTLGNTGRERFDEYQKELVYGIPYGWDTLDDATLGAHPGDLVLFAGRPGQGKSYMMLKNIDRAWEDGNRILVVATEMPPLQMLRRFDAVHLGLDYDLFKKRMLTTTAQEAYKRFVLDDAGNPSHEDLMIVHGTGMTPSALNVLIDQVSPDIVFIDSVHKMEPDRKYREGWEKFRHLANELKDNVAQKNEVPVICNTHFNREVGGQFGGKTKNIEGDLNQLAGGDEWGKVADLVIGLSRGMEENANKALKLKVIKGREAEDGKSWHVQFDFSTMAFSEVNLLHTENDQAIDDRKEEKGGLPW